MEPNIGGVASGMSKKTIGIIVGVVVLGIVGYVVSHSAGYLGKRAIESATGGSVQYGNNGSATYKTNDGTVTTGVNALPEGWPSDAPGQYSGSTITFSGAAAQQGGKMGMTVIMTTTDSAANVAAFYKSDLAAKGWTIQGTYTASGTTTIVASKDDRAVGITVVGTEGTTQISVGIGSK